MSRIRAAVLALALCGVTANGANAEALLLGKRFSFQGTTKVTSSSGDTNDFLSRHSVYFGKDGRRFVYVDGKNGIVLEPGQTSAKRTIPNEYANGDRTISVKETSRGFTASMQVFHKKYESTISYSFKIDVTKSGCKVSGYDRKATHDEIWKRIKRSPGPCKVADGPIQ